MKKKLALLLSALLLLALAAGCAPGSETPSSAAPDAGSAGDAAGDADGELDFVALNYYIRASEQDDAATVQAAMDEYLTSKLNCTLTVYPVNDWTTKMPLVLSSGEQVDLTFDQANTGYYTNVANNLYLPLDDLLAKYGQGIVENMEVNCPGLLDAPRVGGKLYGIPLQQIYVRQTGIRFNTELLNKYGFDPSTVKTLDDLDEYAATIKASEPDAVVIYNYGHLIYENMVNYLGYDVIVSNTTPGVVYYAAETPVVFNQFESEEFKALCEKMREWNLAGYFPTDAVTGADSVGENDIRAIDTDPAHKPGGDITEGQLRGYDITGIAFGDCAMTTGAVQATITAVSATSKNIERAVAFINLLDSDPEVLNLICHGIEGTDYEFVGDKADGLIKPISDYPGMLSFLVGNVFNEYYTDASQVGTWPETAEINANAQASCILGFAFDSEPVATQIAQCSAVVEEYLPALNCGAVDVDSTLEAFNAALKDAGVEQIIAEMQSQIDAWLATK